jgi:hypothetical protein
MGTSDKAVRIQNWSVISTHMLVGILNKTHRLELGLHEILQVLSVTPFKNSLYQNCLRHVQSTLIQRFTRMIFLTYYSKVG